MVSTPKLELNAATPSKACPNLVHARVLVGCGEGVDKQRLIVDIRYSHASCAIEKERAGSHAEAGTSGPQPIRVDRLLHGEIRGSAAGIGRSAHIVMTHVNRAESRVLAESKMSVLKALGIQ